MKKQSNLSRLLDYAGTYRILCYLSWVLAADGALLALVSRQGYINCYALITEGNLASEEFHKALGFEPAARLEHCGYKMGQWLNLCYYHLALSARPQAPVKPVPLSAVPAEQAESVLRRAAMLVKGAGGH